MELILLIIALQLAFISTTLFIGTIIVGYYVFLAPPPSNSMLPFILPLGEDLVGRKMTSPEPKGTVPHTTGGRYA